MRFWIHFTSLYIYNINASKERLIVANSSSKCATDRIVGGTLKLNLKTCFTAPYSPWQRDTNEQTSGLLRRYFPKGNDFSKVSDQAMKTIVLKINQCPRTCLGYQALYEVFAEALRGAPAT